jgi:hypothetical protein
MVKASKTTKATEGIGAKLQLVMKSGEWEEDDER